MDDSKLSRSEFMKRDSKFTDLQKGYLKQFVADCLIKRFTIEESLLYLKDKLGIQVEEDEFNYLKGELKRDIRRNVHYLRRYEYACDVLKNESETVDDNSLEDRPAVVNEIRASQYNPKKIAKYKSDGKLAPTIH